MHLVGYIKYRKCEECAGEMSGVHLEDGTCSGFSKLRVNLLYSSFFVKWLVKGTVVYCAKNILDTVRNSALRLSMLGKCVREMTGIKKALKVFTEGVLQPTTTEGWARCIQHFTKTENPL